MITVKRKGSAGNIPKKIKSLMEHHLNSEHVWLCHIREDFLVGTAEQAAATLLKDSLLFGDSAMEYLSEL